MEKNLNQETIYNKMNNTSFNKVIRGYNIIEVDNYIKDLISKNRNLNNQIVNQKKSIDSYNKQDKFLRSALIRAEETSSSIIENAENQSKLIISQAKEDAYEIKMQAKIETKEYKEEIYSYLYKYKKEIKEMVGKFNLIATKYTQQLQNELLSEIETRINQFDNTYNKFSIKINENKIDKYLPSKNTQSDYTQDELSLVGCIVTRDICNDEGYVVVKKNTVISPHLIEYISAKGLYNELTIAIDNQNISTNKK